MDALVLSTARLEATVAFYRAVGLPLREERHEVGPLHYACDFQGLHFAIYDGFPGDAPERRTGGSTQFGFQVASVDEVVGALLRQGARVLIEPERMPWGRRAVVLDPDGRPVELNQSGGKAGG